MYIQGGKSLGKPTIKTNVPSPVVLQPLRRRKSYATDVTVKKQRTFKEHLLEVEEPRETLSETNLVSASLNRELTSTLLQNDILTNRNGRQILSPILPPYLKNNLGLRRISVSKTKISPPFIQTASGMISSSRVSFQDLVTCVLHCLQHLMGNRGKVQAPNDDLSVKQICYEIAFNVLKYRTVIVDVLNESHFYATFPKLQDVHQLVTILTFIQYIIEQPLPKDNVYHHEIRTILRALFIHKIHIDASFARSRIKLNAATVIHLLPEEDRAEYEKSTQIDENAPPYYSRINKVKNSTEDVIGALQQHFKYYPATPDKTQLNKNPGFYRDSEFKDLLVFSHSLREELTGLAIVKESSLVLQERVLSYVISSLQGLIIRGFDIIQTHAGSGSLSTYLASVVDGNKCKLRVCGCSPGDIPHLQRNVSKQGIRNTELLSVPFLNYTIPEKPAIQAIVCTPPNTMSAIREPFRYALYEGDYSVAGEKVNKNQTSLRQYVVHQTKTLRQALTYPKVTTVIYFTLSSNFQENEGVVRNCLEEFNEKCENPAHRFNPIPVLPSVRHQMINDPTAERPSSKEFYKFIEPDAGYAGGFLTVLYRKMPEDPKPPQPEESISTSTVRLNNPNIQLNSRESVSQTSLQPNTNIKRKKKGHAKVISMGMGDDNATFLTSDLSKLALIEKQPSIQTFKKEFIQSYEMIMGPGSRAKMTKMKQARPKKEPEPVLPKVSTVITKAMESRKREKFKPTPIHRQIIDHPHPFK